MSPTEIRDKVEDIYIYIYIEWLENFVLNHWTKVVEPTNKPDELNNKLTQLKNVLTEIDVLCTDVVEDLTSSEDASIRLFGRRIKVDQEIYSDFKERYFCDTNITQTKLFNLKHYLD